MTRKAFTLLETLIAVTLLAILASVVVTASSSAGTQSLESLARVVAADLRLARNQAVQYNSAWTVRFDPDDNAYELVHTGTGNPPQLQLPFATPGDPYRVELHRLGTVDADNGVRLNPLTLKSSGTIVTDVTFEPLGGTGPLRTEDTMITLTRTQGTTTQAVRLTISWLTGRVQLERASALPTTPVVSDTAPAAPSSIQVQPITN